jgi:restriction endonuclease Mrr
MGKIAPEGSWNAGRSKTGVSVITEAGKNLLKQHDGPVNMNVLMQFPSYQEFRSLKTTSSSTTSQLVDPEKLTPEEHIEYGFEQHRRLLASDLIEKVKVSPSDFFERLVVELLVAMGYGGSRSDAGRAVGKGGLPLRDMSVLSAPDRRADRLPRSGTSALISRYLKYILQHN